MKFFNWLKAIFKPAKRELTVKDKSEVAGLDKMNDIY